MKTNLKGGESMSNNFFEEGYELPNTSNYMKFEEGANTFRILGKFSDGDAIMGTVYWVTTPENKRTPKRLPMGKPVPVGELEINPKTGEIENPKHFWALPVWNYSAKKVQILEITQKTIQQAIMALAANPKWGDPVEYDIVVNRVDESNKTSYSVTPDPKEKVSNEIVEAAKATPINIKALFESKDPFSTNEVVEDIDNLPID